jgi:hypothetical protein
MDLGAILLLIALLVGVSSYLLAPLINDRSRRFSGESQEISTLMAERERILNALQELDFDFKLGKIPEGEYPGQRAELLQKGAEVLKKLDSLSVPPPSNPRRRARSGEGSASTASEGAHKQLSDDQIESMLSARRRERKTKSAGFCPRCGKPVLITDQFCPHCGKALK